MLIFKDIAVSKSLMPCSDSVEVLVPLLKEMGSDIKDQLLKMFYDSDFSQHNHSNLNHSY